MALDTVYSRAGSCAVYIPGATSGGTGDDAATIVAALMAHAVTGTTTFAEAIRAITAATAGKPVFTDNDHTLAFRDLDDTKDVLTVTLDDTGNVTALTTDLT